MQYLLNIAQYPRPAKPRPPLLIDAPDEAGILAKADEIVQQVRAEGAQKVQVQVRQAVNLARVAHVGDGT
jgi:hypothetical protein